MAYTVRVRGVEIVCESIEDLDDIVQRYGLSEEGMTQRPASAARNGSGASTAGNRGNSDVALLRSFIEGGSAGITSEVIGSMLAARGKGMFPALNRWAIRVGLGENAASLVEPARPQGARGWRLNEAGLRVAREVLNR